MHAGGWQMLYWVPEIALVVYMKQEKKKNQTKDEDGGEEGVRGLRKKQV